MVSIAVGLLVSGCASAGPQKGGARRTVDPALIYARAGRSYARALFYKPKPDTEGLIDPTLAPLIAQELPTDPKAAPTPGIGLVFVDADGQTRVHDTLPVVYVDSSNAYVAGSLRHQNRFAWCHEAARSHGRVDVVCRGVRVTYGGDGFPIVWEVLDPGSPADVVFVSESVESAAAERFGPPLPGRHYSIERPAGRGAIVPLVLSDGPVPMGPYVYLEADRNEIDSLRCRCMSSKVDNYTETREYEVLPMAELGKLAPRLDINRGALESRLRWPDGIE